jgi:hypothetical protein
MTTSYSLSLVLAERYDLLTSPASFKAVKKKELDLVIKATVIQYVKSPRSILKILKIII